MTLLSADATQAKLQQDPERRGGLAGVFFYVPNRRFSNRIGVSPIRQPTRLHQ